MPQLWLSHVWRDTSQITTTWYRPSTFKGGNLIQSHLHPCSAPCLLWVVSWFPKVSNVHAAWVTDHQLLPSQTRHNTEQSAAQVASSAGALACISSSCGRGPARRDSGKAEVHRRSLPMRSVQEAPGWSWSKEAAKERAEAVRSSSKRLGTTLYPKVRCCLSFVWIKSLVCQPQQASAKMPASLRLSYSRGMQLWTWEMQICTLCWKSCCDMLPVVSNS